MQRREPLFQTICIPYSTDCSELLSRFVSTSVLQVFLYTKAKLQLFTIHWPLALRRMEDKIRTLCQKIIATDGNSEEFRIAADELRSALSSGPREAIQPVKNNAGR